jgi:acetyl esterase/lipase
VKAGAPPFLVTYCEWDYFTLPAQARSLHRSLEDAGVNAELVYIPGENHLSEMINVASENDPLVAAALKFMK